MNLEVHNFTQNQVDLDFFKKIIETVLDFFKKKEEIEISLAIVGESRMRRLNKMYRGKNRVTDVLSFGNKNVLEFLAKVFPRSKKKNSSNNEFVLPPDGINRLGEIVICYPQAKKQAKLLGHSLDQEIAQLLIHGTLHLLGYDHQKSPVEAEEMSRQEKKILNLLNLN